VYDSVRQNVDFDFRFRQNTGGKHAPKKLQCVVHAKDWYGSVKRFHTWDHSTATFRTIFSYMGPFVPGPFRSWTFRIFVPGMFSACQNVGLRHDGADVVVICIR